MDMDTGRGGRGIGRWTAVAVGVLVVIGIAAGVASGAVGADPRVRVQATGAVTATGPAATEVAGADTRANATTISLGRPITIRNPTDDDYDSKHNWYKVYVGDRGARLRINYTGDGKVSGYNEGGIIVGHVVNGSYREWSDGYINGYSSRGTSIPKPVDYVVKESGYVYISTWALDGSETMGTFTVTTATPDAGVYGVANTSVIPATAQPGQELTVATDVTYRRNVVNPERAVVRLSVDGQREAVSYHDISTGETANVQFTHPTNYTDETGQHNVTVEALPAWAVKPRLDGTTDTATYTLEASDIDGDGLYDFREEQGETDKTNPDTDGDGLEDGREIELGTDPTVADSDGDGLEDGREVELGTDPNTQDTDGEGLDDPREQEVGTNATKADTDSDGLDDAQELELDTEPTNPDTDGDGTEDGAEIENGTDPLAAPGETATTTGGTDGGSSDGTDGGSSGGDGDAAAGTVGGGGEQNVVTAGGGGGGLPLPGTPVLAGALLLGLLAVGGAVYARRRSRRQAYDERFSAGSSGGSDESGVGGASGGSAGGGSGVSGDSRTGRSTTSTVGGGAGASAGAGAAATDGLSSGGAFEYDDLEVGERIGAGGNADVFHATAPDGTPLAVKQPRLQGTVGRETMAEFVGEAEQWAALDDSEFIVDVLGWGAQPIPWLGMEYMAGGSLAEHDLGALEFGDAVGLSLAIVGGVKHAHEYGVVHHDLKPENVLLSDDASPDVKVADWGLSKLLLEHSGSVEGLSPQYAAPEQFDPDRFGRPDKRTDIYQLGAVCYELFTGRPPFEGDQSTVMYSTLEKEVSPPTRIDPQLPPAIDDVLLKALAKDPADRYESVLYLRDDLAELDR